MNLYGYLTSEQRRTLRERPRHRMRYFAELLGWRGLRMEYMWFTHAEVATGFGPDSGLEVYYHTGAWRFALQINETRGGEPFPYKATVIPDRYGMRPVGWHPFALFDDDRQLWAEAERIRPYLGRRLFIDPAWRRELKRKRPELMLKSKKRSRCSELLASK